MKLSSHEEYGLRCLLQVARHGATGSATIPEISHREGISPAYVGKLMRILRQGGFVTSARGKTGGYTLALPPEHIRVGDALAVLGGRIYGDDFCRAALRLRRHLPPFHRLLHPLSLALLARRH